MIWHPHWWADTGFGYAGHLVERQCKICKRYQRWTGKYADYPNKQWEDGRAERGKYKKTFF